MALLLFFLWNRFLFFDGECGIMMEMECGNQTQKPKFARRMYECRNDNRKNQRQH